MSHSFDIDPPDEKRKKPRRKFKGPNDVIKKTAVVLREGVVFKREGTDEVFMPTTITMSNDINPNPELRREILFTKSMKPDDIQEVLKKTLPVLTNIERFYCAKAVQKEKLDFCGERRIWSGEVLNREIKGHSVLYIYYEEVNSGQHTSLIAPVENMQISRNESSSEDCRDSSFEACNTSEGSSRNQTDPLLSGSITRSPEPWHEFRANPDVELFYPLNEVEKTVNGYSETDDSIGDAFKVASTSSYDPESEGTMQDTLSRNFSVAPNNTEVEQTNQDVAQENSHSQEEIVEPTQDVEQEQSSGDVIFQLQQMQLNASQVKDNTDLNSELMKIASDRGFIIADNEGLGNCMFYALSNQLEIILGIKIKPDELRQVLVQYLRKNPILANGTDLSGFIYGHQSWNDYLMYMGQDGTWGDHVILCAAANCYKTCIHVVSSLSTAPDVILEPECSVDKSKTLVLGHIHEVHYVSLHSTQAPNNAEVEETNQDVAQENSHSLMEVVEPTQDVEKEQLVREICPSWSPLEGGGHFQISVKKDLPEHVKSGYARFGDMQVNLEKFNSLTWKGVIPASQEPGVVAVHVFSDTRQFLGETTFKYEDMREKVVSQAVDQGGDGLSDLLSLIGKLVWSRSSSLKQNSEQATGALNGSCQKRPSPAENNIMDDKCEDFGQYFQDIVKWLSEESFHPGHSNTDVWLKLSKAIYGLCKKLDSAGDELNFTSDQHASPQESEASYFADAETSSCTSSNSASSPDPEDWSQPLNAPLTGFISQPSVPKTEDDGNEKHPWWNKSSSEPQRTDDNLLNDDHNAVEDITKKFESFPALQNDTDHHTDSELNTASSWGKDKKTPAVQECEETGSVLLVYGSSSEYQEADPKAESTQHSHKGEPDMSQEIQATMTEGFTSEFSIGDNKYVGSGDCPECNTPLPESTKTEVNYEEEDHDEKQDLSQEWALYSEESAWHTVLASQDNTPVLLLDVRGVNVENEENQYSDDEISEILHTEKAQHSESSHDISFARTEVLVNGFDLCENEDAGKIVHSRWEILPIEPNKTDGGAEEDNFDTEQDLSLEQGLFSEEGNLHTHLSLPDDTSVQIRRPEVENKESQEEQMQVSDQFSTDSKQSGAHTTLPPLCSNASDIPKMIPVTLPLALQPNLPTGDLAEQKNCSTLLSRLESLKISGEDKEFQKSHEQAYTETFPVKGSLSGQPLRQPRYLKTQVSAKEASVSAVTKDNQQHTPVTLRASDDQLIGDISIIEAAGKGYSNRVRQLIEKGADVNQRERVDTPLTAAAKNGHLDIVRLLIENGADVNEEEGILNNTPLTAAVKKGHTDISRLLIENGADVNKQRFDLEDTPLVHAARNGCTDTVRLLIENGADLNKAGWKDIPLTAAAKKGHTDVVRVLLENGADVNKEEWEDSPLTAAVKNGRTDIVSLLLENGADVNKGKWDTPLTAAVKNGDTDIFRLLLENGADVNKGVWDTPLTAAVKNGDTDIFRLLLENGADVNEGVRDTPLSAAVKNGDTDIFRLLLENGADVNKGVWDTPLSAAVRNGNIDIVRLLLENGADVNKGVWVTPLSAAAKNGNADIVRLLLESGADVNKGVPDTAALQNGHALVIGLALRRPDTPLSAALMNGNTDIVRLLLENGADVNKGVREGTPLAEAVKNGHTDLVRLLIENAGDVNYGGFFGTTTLTEAARIGHNDIVGLLVEKGTDFSKEGGSTELSLERCVDVVDVQRRGKKKTSRANSRKYENEPREISFDKNREDEAEENDDVDPELYLVSSYPCLWSILNDLDDT